VLNARLILGRLVRVLATALARANPALSHPAASILLPARSSATLTLSIASPPSQCDDCARDEASVSVVP
jgi:hypothetical protein